ncbi:methylated-DNA--[protein]-cysteine S-methyltransferase [Mycobacterium sp.]|uniref:methylated-DNA--[protein]-cysteine S-methyltransferase n=1 Tax=Mycobacterium sp. TaxID=1785 RepID=UPI0031D6B4E4
MIHYRIVDSPIGPLTLAGRGRVLTSVRMAGQTHDPDCSAWVPDDAAFPDAVTQLEEYFARERTEFDVEFSLAGTEFQRRVWRALTRIPYGETRSYGQIAAHIGACGAARAVGLANGRNPVAIIVPCHRVIGANGHLTGYGGGLDRKRSLIELENGRTVANWTPSD